MGGDGGSVDLLIACRPKLSLELSLEFIEAFYGRIGGRPWRTGTLNSRRNPANHTNKRQHVDGPQVEGGFRHGGLLCIRPSRHPRPTSLIQASHRKANLNQHDVLQTTASYWPITAAPPLNCRPAATLIWMKSNLTSKFTVKVVRPSWPSLLRFPTLCQDKIESE